jgi:formate hydrogenlyase subunit 3/multisubunit Na+/H+ antiporter MnhD subunit
MRLSIPNPRRVIAALTLLLPLVALTAAVLVAQDTVTVVAEQSVPGSLAELLTAYQLGIATLLGSAIVYLLAKHTAFSTKSDRVKRGSYLAAALLVTVALKLAGGTLSPDLESFVVTGLQTLVSTVTGAGVYAMGKSQPGNA